MKKILIIHESLGGGGAERVLISLLNNFDFQKYSIDLLLIYKTGIYLKQLPSDIRLFHIYEDTKKNKFISFLNRIGLVRFIEKKQVSKLNLQPKYDAIISFIEGLSVRYHSLLLHKSNNNITWVHTNLQTNHWTKIFFRNKMEEEGLYKRFNEIIFVSEGAKIAFNNVFNTNNNQRTIYNIVNTEQILKSANEFDIKKAGFTVVTVGRLIPQKRHDRLIECADILIKKRGLDINFWIVGEGYLEEQLKKQVEELGMIENVTFFGFRENPFPYIKNSDVFLLSSDMEGFPMVICESIALGKAIISTNITGSKELLGDSEFGILTELNGQSLADAIESLYQNKKLLDDYQIKAFERSKMFSVQESMNQIYSLIGT